MPRWRPARFRATRGCVRVSRAPVREFQFPLGTTLTEEIEPCHAKLRGHTDRYGPEQPNGRPAHGQLRAVRSTITIDERFGETCLQGLEGFSHVEVLFIFDQFPEHDDYREPRPYRGRSDLPPVGVFAGRGPRRPNRIGVTCCAIESVHGRELTVVGLDAVSGTPVIDLKPTMAEFSAVNIKQPEWVSRLMSEYFQP
ncbi:SAM-dependent methyltransferase [Streptomyces sp. NBC_00316]|uniref:SAM-dependent methyltransferase n=1 Tax=Streptomyces sp. NBC_00316 TaxID=2975710 RepID=UPI002E2C8D0F|nr:SAM-dependent methyltransferase [Streptomyces sp. NBC_00316]